MSITDELREYALGWDERNRVRCDLTAIADRIDAEHERQLEVLYRDMSDAEYVKLPKDADGEYIHVGDMLAGEKAGGFGLCEPFEVGCIMFGRGIVQVNDVHGLARCVEFAHHHRPDTWERIIEDAIDAVDDSWADDEHDKLVETLVARCKKLAGDAE